MLSGGARKTTYGIEESTFVHHISGMVLEMLFSMLCEKADNTKGGY